MRRDRAHCGNSADKYRGEYHASNLHHAAPSGHARHPRRSKLAPMGPGKLHRLRPKPCRSASPGGDSKAVACCDDERLLTMTSAESLLIASIIAALGLFAAPDLVAWWNGFQPVMVTP